RAAPAPPRPLPGAGVHPLRPRGAPGAVLRPRAAARLKAFVTGAAGFIGAHVVRTLIEAGHDVRALYLPGEDLRNLRGLPATQLEPAAGDATAAPARRRAVRGCGWVFPLAALYRLWTRDPARLREVNVEGTRIVLAAAEAERVERVVHTSSIARYGG